VRPDILTTQNSGLDSLDTSYRLPFEKGSLEKLPASPGVYVVRDAADRIIYVGKAKNLRKRVESYFRKNLSPKTAAMVANARFFSFITAGTEDQALVLESIHQELSSALQPFNWSWKVIPPHRADSRCLSDPQKDTSSDNGQRVDSSGHIPSLVC